MTSFSSRTTAGWEALNERQTGLLMEQRREIELAEAGMPSFLFILTFVNHAYPFYCFALC